MESCDMPSGGMVRFYRRASTLPAAQRLVTKE